jgi:two-component system, NarL family, response regulator NreC
MPQGETTRVVLADDHKIFRQALRALMQREGIEVVGEASDGEEAVQMTQAFHPDVTVLDFGMPGLNGIDAARKIHEASPDTQTVLLTMHEDESLALEALRAGMHGFLQKSQPADELVTTVQEVARGAIHVSGGMSKSAITAYATGQKTSPDPLTAREREVLRLIAEGKTTRQIARMLRLSPKTVESHRNRLMQKLDIHGTAALTRYAVRRHLIQP